MVENPGTTTTENQWQCSNCSFILEAKVPPENCPSCHHRCEFLNVTCYTPDCNFTGVDPRLTKK